MKPMATVWGAGRDARPSAERNACWNAASKSARKLASRRACLVLWQLAGSSLLVLAPGARAETAGADAAASPARFAPITPYRPSVSSPAQLPAPGQLEVELGGLHQRSSDGSRRSSVPYTLKLAVDPAWGLVLGGEAHVWSRDDAGNRAQGFGDTSLVLKHAWLVDDATAFGVELGAKVPTANDTIGSGRADYTVNTIFSRDIGPVHVDANLNATRLGAIDPGTGRTLIGAAASFSGAIVEHFGWNVEPSGTRRSGADSSAQLLAALTYSPSKFLTFDVGAARVFRGSPGSMQFFTGVVFPLAKLW